MSVCRIDIFLFGNIRIDYISVFGNNDFVHCGIKIIYFLSSLLTNNYDNLSFKR